MRASLECESDASPEGVALHRIGAEDLSTVHALICWKPFTASVTKLRYTAILERPSGLMPLFRHAGGPGLSAWREPATWRNDALCAALQVINHLQDCGRDYRDLNRVYLPEDALAEAGVTVEALAAPAASPGLKSVIAALARKNALLLDRSSGFARQIRDGRLALEVDLIQTLAEDLNAKLMRRDPLSENVHHSRMIVAALFLKRLPMFALRRAIQERRMSEALDAPQASEEKANGSSFYTAMRLMPKQERSTAAILISPCRNVDDIADDGIGTRPERHRRMDVWRADLDAIYAGAPPSRRVPCPRGGAL